MSEAHICPRREHNPYAPTRPNVLHCYGCDFRSTKEVLAALSDYAPQHVEWIDDSSCNVIFEGSEGSDALATVIRELAFEEQPSCEEPWVTTRPLSTGGKTPSQFQLEVRIATEADRKDVAHSGHTDSAYYASVKEQQAMDKQRLEERQLKKRQRIRQPSDSGMPKALVADSPFASGAASASALQLLPLELLPSLRDLAVEACLTLYCSCALQAAPPVRLLLPLWEVLARICVQFSKRLKPSMLPFLCLKLLEEEQQHLNSLEHAFQFSSLVAVPENLAIQVRGKDRLTGVGTGPRRNTAEKQRKNSSEVRRGGPALKSPDPCQLQRHLLARCRHFLKLRSF